MGGWGEGVRKGDVRREGEEDGEREKRGGRRRSWDGHGRLAGFWKEGRHVGTGSRGS